MTKIEWAIEFAYYMLMVDYQNNKEDPPVDDAPAIIAPLHNSTHVLVQNQNSNRNSEVPKARMSRKLSKYFSTTMPLDPKLTNCGICEKKIRQTSKA